MKLVKFVSVLQDEKLLTEFSNYYNNEKVNHSSIVARLKEYGFKSNNLVAFGCGVDVGGQLQVLSIRSTDNKDDLYSCMAQLEYEQADCLQLKLFGR